MFKSFCFAGVFTSFCALGAPVPLCAQTVTYRNGAVSVSANGVSLEQVLGEFAAITPMDLKIDPAVRGREVSITLQDVSIESAIAQVLTQSGVDYAAAGLYRTDARTPIRLVAGDPKRAIAFTAPPLKDVAPHPPVSHPPSQPLLTKKTGEVVEDDEPSVSPSKGSVSGAAATPSDPEAAAAASSREIFNAVVGTGWRKTPPGEGVMLPFTNPDGSPVIVPATPAPTPARTPGPAKPPGQ